MTAAQGCPWCGQTTANARPVAHEDIPRLVAQFLSQLLAAGTPAAERETVSPVSVPAPALTRPSTRSGWRAVPVALDTLEREHIVTVLRQVVGNRMAAARILGISRRALYRRLERYRIVDDVPRFAAGRRV